MKPEIIALLKLLLSYSQKGCLCSKIDEIKPLYEALTEDDRLKIKEMIISMPYNGDKTVKRSSFNFPEKAVCVNPDEMVWAIMKIFF
jgi:hypothetical protein